MVKYGTLIKIIEDYTEKCEDYPKANALNYYNEHKKEFKKETWDKGVDHSQDDESPKGHLFTAQSDLQWNANYTNLQMALLNEYGGSLFKGMAYYNYDLRDKVAYGLENQGVDKVGDLEQQIYIPHYNENRQWYTEEEGHLGGDFQDIKLKEASDEVQRMIDNSPRIQEDCIVWRWGRLPTNAKGEQAEVGESGVYKGFTGASYNRRLVGSKRAWLRQLIRKNWGNDDNRYRIQYYVMKGNKAVLLDKSTGTGSWQNEILFGRNQRGVVVERDDEKRTATVVLYPTKR